MTKKSKAQICPKCNQRTLYIEKRSDKYKRYRCINRECNFTRTFKPHISKSKINNLNSILNFLNMCLEKKRIDNIGELKLNCTKTLTVDNIDGFKITYNENPNAYIENKSIVLFCNSNEIRFISLKDYNKTYKRNEENITYLPPGYAYNKKDNNF